MEFQNIKLNSRIAAIIFIVSSMIASASYALRPLIILTGGLETPLGQYWQSLSYANTEFNYQPHISSAVKPLIGVFVGAESPLNQQWAWQFGLGYYQAVGSNVNGEESQTPTDNPLATNLWDYQYKIVGRQLLIENKLILVLQKIYRPYVLIGLGEGFNRAYAFQVTPQNSGEVATAVFRSRSTNSFVYLFGVGIDFDLSQQVRLGAGYRYAYLGSYDLGPATLDTGVGGSVFFLPALASQHAYNQEVLVQLTYLFQEDTSQVLALPVSRYKL